MTVPADGLQQERTLLAWRRSALAFFGVGLLVVRGSISRGSPVAFAVAALGLALSVVVFLATLLRGRWTSPSRREPKIRVLRDGRLPAVITLIALIPGVAVVLLASGLFE